MKPKRASYTSALRLLALATGLTAVLLVIVAVLSSGPNPSRPQSRVTSSATPAIPTLRAGDVEIDVILQPGTFPADLHPGQELDVLVSCSGGGAGYGFHDLLVLQIAGNVVPAAAVVPLSIPTRPTHNPGQSGNGLQVSLSVPASQALSFSGLISRGSTAEAITDYVVAPPGEVSPSLAACAVISN